MIADFDAVILAGGRGSRLGGVRKPELVVRGRRLLDVALAAAAAARRVVVVGDVTPPDHVLGTREDPPYGGPVAGLAAGFDAFDRPPNQQPAPWTLVLASDLPDAEAAVRVLLNATPGPDHDGACLVDDDRRLQWLLGYYRTPVLRRRLAERAGATAMYRLLEPLRLLAVDPGAADVSDVDTAEDAARWAARTGTPPSPDA